MRNISKLLLMAAFSLGFAAYNFRDYLWDYSYYHLTALEFVVLYFIIFLETKPGWWRVTAKSMCVICIVSFFDEFKLPESFRIQEYIGGLVIVLISIVHEALRRRPKNNFKGFRRLGD